MPQEIVSLPKQSIIVNQDVNVFIRISLDKKPADLGKITGLLKQYKNKYTSVELQHKSKEWWASVSN